MLNKQLSDTRDVADSSPAFYLTFHQQVDDLLKAQLTKDSYRKLYAEIHSPHHSPSISTKRNYGNHKEKRSKTTGTAAARHSTIPRKPHPLKLNLEALRKQVDNNKRMLNSAVDILKETETPSAAVDEFIETVLEDQRRGAEELLGQK